MIQAHTDTCHWQFKLRLIAAERLRLLPDFIIIGAQKCGTTSLYRNLTATPGITAAATKEVDFFVSPENYRQGERWYRAHFPLRLQKHWAKVVCHRSYLTGESTPYLLFHPCSPERVFRLLPAVKLIVLLRNPVDRAYSHYQHFRRAGWETCSFADAIAHEDERLRGEAERLLADATYHSVRHRRYSYCSRGIYVDQLQAWLRVFSRDQFLVLKAEEFFEQPEPVIHRVQRFLGLPESRPASARYRRFNEGEYATLDPGLRRELTAYFRPHNQRLYAFLGTDFGWES